MRRSFVLLAVPLLAALLLVPSASASGSHYVPQVGDSFQYAETVSLNGGVGNYTGYTEDSHYTGSIALTAVLPNGTESASYQASGTYSNNQGQSGPWSESGMFTFSATTFHYVRGTDNQSGYVDPYVWFYMDNTLSNGSMFYALNTPMTVVSTDHPFADSASATGYVRTIFSEGNGSYQRDDSYGRFTATDQWMLYTSPTTGYVVGYVYTETDRDAGGDGFTYTDTLTDSHTSFPLAAASAPPPPPATFPWGTVIVVVVAVVILLVVIAVIVWAVRSRSRRPGHLPRHPAAEGAGVVPTFAPPTPVNLIPRDQPPVQQVVLRETVKVPCRYCGTLIDSTMTACPKCGAPRT